jgi:hypothetical protein
MNTGKTLMSRFDAWHFMTFSGEVAFHHSVMEANNVQKWIFIFDRIPISETSDDPLQKRQFVLMTIHSCTSNT